MLYFQVYFERIYLLFVQAKSFRAEDPISPGNRFLDRRQGLDSIVREDQDQEYANLVVIIVLCLNLLLEGKISRGGRLEGKWGDARLHHGSHWGSCHAVVFPTELSAKQWGRRHAVRGTRTSCLVCPHSSLYQSYLRLRVCNPNRQYT